jgi:hypothetical protein
LALQAPGDRPRLSLSLGAATAEKGESLVQALKDADERMYREKILKAAGRDSEITAAIRGRGNS